MGNRAFERLFPVAWLAVLALAFTGCGAGGGLPEPAVEATVPIPAVSWPPPQGPLKQVSETQLVLRGRDWTAKGHRAYTEGDYLILRGGEGTPWGMYGLDYLSEDNELESLSLLFTVTPLTPGDRTRLYVGLANYHDDCWEWHLAGVSPWPFTYQYPRFYRSPEGNGYIACVLAGPGQVQVEQLTINVSGTVVPAPQNLTGESPDVGVVALDWDSVPLADSYNVYRAHEPDWQKAGRLNDEPVTANHYEDSGMTTGKYYWYWVTAVASNESGPSNPAAVWTHQIELPAPLNPRVSARDETSFTVAWDWLLLNPNQGFTIFVCTYKDFPTGDEDVEIWPAYPAARESGIYGRIPGFIYYWKMCAKHNGLYGRMTDELTGSTKGSWTWGDFEVVDTGHPPVRAVAADGKLAIAYIKDDSVTLATDQGDHWRIDTPLPHGPKVMSGSVTYGQYLDLAYYGGTFLVAGYDAWACDAWAATGQQYDWRRDRIHGDGHGFPPMPPNSGLFIQAAISPDEMAVVHLDLTGEDQADPNDAQLLVHRKPFSGGSWNTERIRYFNTEVLPSHSLCYHGGELHVLTTDLFSSVLYTCDSEGHWTLVDVTPPGQEGLVKHHDLQWFNDQWYSPAFHYSNQQLFLLTGLDPPWDDRLITDPAEDMGHEARLAVEGNEAVMIFYGYNFGHARYQFAVYSEDWVYRPIGVPHVASDKYGGGADIVLMDGSPYFVFWDEETEEIKVAKGTPPEE